MCQQTETTPAATESDKANKNKGAGIMLTTILEWIGVVISWNSKWLKASDARRMRKIGFIVAQIVNIYWGVLFSTTGQYALVFNAIVNSIIAFRGIKNNSAKNDRIKENK